MAVNKYNNFFADRTVLVTGGAGFIGSHLTQHLLALGACVHVLDDLSSGNTSNIANFEVNFIEGSILDADSLQKSIQGCSLVFHEAAFVSVPESFEKADRCFEVNIKGTSNVLKFAKKEGCQRVVFASSAACYGSNPNLPSKESDAISAESPYAQSKVMGEQLMRDAVVDTVSLRYFNVFGQRQDPHSAYAAVISAFADSIIRQRKPTIFGDGTQSRDFTHVSNVVHANLLAASHTTPLLGEAFNVGTGNMLSLLEVLQAMTENNIVDANYGPTRHGDVQHSCADIEKIKAVLGYAVTEKTVDSLMDFVNPKQH
jgi:nucleoside-diphosphate-sugar epimerase